MFLWCLAPLPAGAFFPPRHRWLPKTPFSFSPLWRGMMISALPFAFHYAVFSRELKTTRMRPEIYVYLGIIFASILMFYFFVASTDTTSRLMTSAFHVMSAMTTSGFQFVDIQLLSAEGKMMLITLMLIGGAAFSIAGGIKVGRILQIVRKVTKRKFATDTSTRSISSASSRYNNSFSAYRTENRKTQGGENIQRGDNGDSPVCCRFFCNGCCALLYEQNDFLDSLFVRISLDNLRHHGRNNLNGYGHCFQGIPCC